MLAHLSDMVVLVLPSLRSCPPPEERAADNPWPEWPKVYKLDYGQEEAKEVFGEDPRKYLTMTKRFIGDDAGNLKSIMICDIEWQERWKVLSRK